MTEPQARIFERVIDTLTLIATLVWLANPGGVGEDVRLWLVLFAGGWAYAKHCYSKRIIPGAPGV